MKTLRNILWGTVAVNIILLIMFILPPGRVYYMPGFFAELTGVLAGCAMFGILPISVCAAVLALFMVIYKKAKKYPVEINNILLLIIHLFGIMLGRFVFLAAMSV